MLRFFQRLSSFLNYQYKAVNAHGLHSPFVFTLYNQVIKRNKPEEARKMKKLRTAMLQVSGDLNYSDPKTGATRRINLRQFAKSSASSHKFSYFLYKLINHLEYKRILETGTCTGVNTAYLASSNAQEIHTIEGAPEIARVAQSMLAQQGFNHIKIIEGKVQNLFGQVIEELKPDLIFLDADHRRETIRFYLDQIQERHSNISCIIIHDIHWSADMEEAWAEVVQNPAYMLTIDLFQAGVIFPNHPMEKQHFIIKF